MSQLNKREIKALSSGRYQGYRVRCRSCGNEENERITEQYDYFDRIPLGLMCRRCHSIYQEKYLPESYSTYDLFTKINELVAQINSLKQSNETKQ